MTDFANEWFPINVILMIGSTIVIAVYITAFAIGRRAGYWPIVTGNIIDSGLRIEQGVKRSSYAIHVLYQFDYNGNTYQSTRIWPTEFRVGFRMWLEKAISPYRPGKSVNVHVNPNNPSKSLLSIQPPAMLTRSTIVAVILFAYTATLNTIAYYT